MGGGVFYTNYAIDSYLDLKPKAAEEGGGSSATTAIVVVVVIAVVIVLVAWLLLRGRGGRAEEA